MQFYGLEFFGSEFAGVFYEAPGDPEFPDIM
jgi:hypothetical protein